MYDYTCVSLSFAEYVIARVDDIVNWARRVSCQNQQHKLVHIANSICFKKTGFLDENYCNFKAPVYTHSYLIFFLDNPMTLTMSLKFGFVDLAFVSFFQLSQARYLV